MSDALTATANRGGIVLIERSDISHVATAIYRGQGSFTGIV